MLVGRRILALGACVAMLALAGCAADDRVLGVPSVRSTVAPKITAEQLVGRWGLGAYHRDTDRARTTVIPGVLAGTTIMDCCSWRPASGLV
jgi:hypothetical protein